MEDSDSSDFSQPDQLQIDLPADFRTPSGYDPENLETSRTEEANCVHEYIAPKGFKRNPYNKDAPMPKQYKFTLDTFQKKAVECID